MPHSIADDFKSIPMSPNLGESLERAHRFAREQTHRTVTLEHLLLALTEDPEAALILQAANVDLGRLRADVSGYLGRLLEDMRAEPGAEPKPDPELLRVLQAAASAAQQSKRKQIDGAIVLAAVVGDGKSPAAGMLKAFGMTFEEAIRALQRANTQARLKTPAKAAGAATPAKAPESAATPEPAAGGATPVASGETSTLSARLATQADTADHILASARARIQQRAAAAAAHLNSGETSSAPTSREPEPPAGEPETAEEVAAATEPPQESHAFEELLAASTSGRPEPAPGGGYPSPHDGAPEPPGRAQRQSWAPAPETRPHGTQRPAQGPIGRAPVPRGARPDDSPRQPQPPRGARPGPAPGGPGPGYPNRPARAPWPEPGDHPGRPPSGMNGSYPGGAPSQAPRPGGPSRGGPQGDRGPLVESVPRRMRVGVTSKAEVRISRDRIEGLVVALNAHGMPHRPDQIAARALSVRLKAPNGGFLIESVSPETQWVEGASGLGHDDYALWRWTVTPQRRGRGRLLLMVSARTIGQDGLAAESAPPDRLIDVRVAPNRMRRLGRWMAWLLVLLFGVAAGRFGDQIWDAGAALIKKVLAG